MGRFKYRRDAFMLSARIMIENAHLVEPIRMALANYGYSLEKIMSLKALYKEADDLISDRRLKYSQQMEATAELKKAWARAEQVYIKTLTIARVAFKDNVLADKAAALEGARKEDLSGWLAQARIFYTNILDNPVLLQRMAQFGYSPEKLREESALLDQLSAMQAKQQKAMGEAQAATKARDEKLNELYRQISDLRTVAKVAMQDHPQLLESLGILVRS